MTRIALLLMLALTVSLFPVSCDKSGEGDNGGGGIELPAPVADADRDTDPAEGPGTPEEPPSMPSSMFAQATRSQVDAIIARMMSDDEDAAGMAMMSLPALPGHFVEHPELIPVVIAALLDIAKSDRNVTMRGMAIDKLIGFKEKAAPAVPDLMKMLEDPETSAFTALYLHRVGAPADPAIDRMVELLTSDSPLVQAYCAEGLGNFGAAAERSVPALAAVLESDSREMVKIKAAHALGKMGPAAKAAIPTLKAISEGPGSNLKFACGSALEKIQTE